MIYAILSNKQVIPATDVLVWAEWLEGNQAVRTIGNERIGDVMLSTVFLGVNHAFGGRPLWFETMIFGGEHDGYQERYTTYDEAVEGHKKALELVSGKR